MKEKTIYKDKESSNSKASLDKRFKELVKNIPVSIKYTKRF